MGRPRSHRRGLPRLCRHRERILRGTWLGGIFPTVGIFPMEYRTALGRSCTPSSRAVRRVPRPLSTSSPTWRTLQQPVATCRTVQPPPAPSRRPLPVWRPQRRHPVVERPPLYSLNTWHWRFLVASQCQPHRGLLPQVAGTTPKPPTAWRRGRWTRSRFSCRS